MSVTAPKRVLTCCRACGAGVQVSAGWCADGDAEAADCPCVPTRAELGGHIYKEGPLRLHAEQAPASTTLEVYPTLP